MTPAVGEVWSAQLLGKVDWADLEPLPVRLTWVADDATVVEGLALRPRAAGKKVVLARCLLVARLEHA